MVNNTERARKQDTETLRRHGPWGAPFYVLSPLRTQAETPTHRGHAHTAHGQKGPGSFHWGLLPLLPGALRNALRPCCEEALARHRGHMQMPQATDLAWPSPGGLPAKCLT